MTLTDKQIKYLEKKLSKNQPLDKIALSLGISELEIGKYMQEKQLGQSNNSFVNTKQVIQTNLSNKIKNFNFKNWLKENLWLIIFLILLVLVAYANALPNEFVSDDVATIQTSPKVDKLEYIGVDFPIVLRGFIYFIINKVVGRNPLFFRLLNLSFHLGAVLISYLLIFLLYGFSAAFLAASLLAVHPLVIEAVTWISGGPYSQYSFFLLLSLLMFVLTLKNRKYYYYSLAAFCLALLSSEKSVVFPLILGLFMFTYKKQYNNWKKLIPYFILSGIITLIYIFRAPSQIANLQTNYYQQPHLLNPLIQIPIALSSYLQLIFWPVGLTLYHTEMFFSSLQFALQCLVVLFLIFLIVVNFKRRNPLFFWLSFFIISLLPTLTPLGVSWIVAERYVYYGTIGIFVAIGLVLDKISQKRGLKVLVYGFFGFSLILLTITTIGRNNDWRNQDNLWLAAAKTSPSSAQNHNNLGDLYGRRRDWDNAIKEFSRAIELLPNYADAYHNLANIYSQTGKLDLALDNYQKALHFNPKLWQSHQNIAAIYVSNKQWDLALEHLKQAVAINPENPDLHNNLAFLYFQLLKYPEALQETKITLSLDPSNQKAKTLMLQLSK